MGKSTATGSGDTFVLCNANFQDAKPWLAAVITVAKPDDTRTCSCTFNTRMCTSFIYI